MAWENFRLKIVNLQSDLSLFKVEFLDRDGFKEFADSLQSQIGGWPEICITGYFSETIRKELEKIIQIPDKKVRIICPELGVTTRDKKNLQALMKMAKAGAEIKINNRLHARFLVGHHLNPEVKTGVLVIGSFDFNTECLGRERYDAGIKTINPDLISSAMKLFNEIWDEPESKPLAE